MRVYRSNQVLAQLPVAVSIKMEGPNLAITLEQRVDKLRAAAGKMVEVETAIPTSGGRYLCYTGALFAGGRRAPGDPLPAAGRQPAADLAGPRHAGQR